MEKNEKVKFVALNPLKWFGFLVLKCVSHLFGKFCANFTVLKTDFTVLKTDFSRSGSIRLISDVLVVSNKSKNVVNVTNVCLSQLKKPCFNLVLTCFKFQVSYKFIYNVVLSGTRGSGLFGVALLALLALLSLIVLIVRTVLVKDKSLDKSLDTRGSQSGLSGLFGVALLALLALLALIVLIVLTVLVNDTSQVTYNTEIINYSNYPKEPQISSLRSSV